MPLFIYRCPITRRLVQGFSTEDVSEDIRTYESVFCVALVSSVWIRLPFSLETERTASHIYSNEKAYFRTRPSYFSWLRPMGRSQRKGGVREKPHWSVRSCELRKGGQGALWSRFLVGHLQSSSVATSMPR